MSALLRELRFSVPWGQLAAKAWGPSEGRPVLCLHGWLDNANTFDRLIPLLPKDYHYVALDFSGHGLSSHLPQGMRYQHMDYLTDVHRVVKALGWRKFSIMGHSMGGVVGGMFASIFPESVRHLILLDSYGFFPISSDLIQSHLKKEIIHYSRLEGANSTKIYTPEGALQRLLDANAALTPETGKLLLQRGTKSVPGGVIFSRDIRVTVNNSAPLSVEQCLLIMKNIQADVHIIMANVGLSADMMRGVYTDVGQALLHGYKESLKGRCQLTVVDGNHFVHLNEPEKVAGIVSNHLRDCVHVQSQL
ncbi:serine hydrolase-like protein 2 [Rhinophrynus dorsalis]